MKTTHSGIYDLSKCCNIFQLLHLLLGLRMSWYDPRIIVQLNETEEYAHLYTDLRQSLWCPDVFLLNSIDVSVSKLALDPVFFRIYRNGKVEFAIREIVQAVCPMNFVNYPVSMKGKKIL